MKDLDIYQLLLDSAECFGKYLLYIIPAACFLIMLHFLCGIKNELFRKLLHTAAYTSAAVIIWIADNWIVAALTLTVFAIVVYPILHVAERWKKYSELFVQRKPGEIKKSLLLLFLSQAVLTAVCWGIFDQPSVAIMAIFMWGTGDAAAALVGKPFGRHKIKLPLADPKKSWEGTAAMVGVSTLVGLIVMAISTTAVWYVCLAFSVVAAVFGAYTELISHNGNDTVTVPAVNSAVLLILHSLI